MKKQGFTLAELLITLGVIGVAAALIAPALGNLMPDRNKLTVLNTAKTINEVTEKLLDNNMLYYNTGNCIGLGCQAAPLDSNYKNFSGKSKFANLFATSLNVDGDITTSEDILTFKAADGTYWTIEPTDVGGATITIDTDGTKGKNCTYNSESCKKPDQFKFVVDQFGRTHAGDALTMAYTQNPTNTKDKKKDLEMAAKLEVTDWANANLVVGNNRYGNVTITDDNDDGGSNNNTGGDKDIIIRDPIKPDPIPVKPVNPDFGNKACDNTTDKLCHFDGNKTYIDSNESNEQEDCSSTDKLVLPTACFKGF